MHYHFKTHRHRLTSPLDGLSHSGIAARSDTYGHTVYCIWTYEQKYTRGQLLEWLAPLNSVI